MRSLSSKRYFKRSHLHNAQSILKKKFIINYNKYSVKIYLFEKFLVVREIEENDL